MTNYPVIVCIAKKEEDYIEEFIKYHLSLGFKYIYLYDNEDVPTYKKLLEKYEDKVQVMHLPYNNYSKGVQYIALDDFERNILFRNNNITHAIHIDIDEFIVLKKHNSICDFIDEYIKGDCQGIGINWRFFGSSGQTEKINKPTTERFTMCEEKGNKHIKTLYKKDNFIKYYESHSIQLSEGHIKSTNGSIIKGPFNENIDFSVIQLNHYKCKTLNEYKYIKTRGAVDYVNGGKPIDVESDFKMYDINEIEELTAKNFYQNILST